jgi:hypothetical protein
MSSIIIQQHPDTRHRPTVLPEDYMPLATRMYCASQLNKLWAEFVNEMHDGETVGPDVARKFWKFVLAGG